MLSHPLLNALFDEKNSQPSKQLSLVRSLLKESVLLKPTILIILPPIESIHSEDSTQFLYHDCNLLSHVLAVPDYNHTEVLTSLNGYAWQIKLSNMKIIPAQGFPDIGSNVAGIINSYIWSPGLPSLAHDAAFFIIETDTPIISNAAFKNFGWFGQRKSTLIAENSREYPSSSPFALPRYSMPSNLASEMRAKFMNPNIVQDNHSTFKAPRPGKLRNPASDLGKSKMVRDQNMAKVDYCLACLQHDAISSSELAERFHRAVTAVRSTLIEAGGLYIESTEQDTAGEDSLEELSVLYSETRSQNLGSAFTLASIYQYAEARLSSHLKQKLAQFLELERKGQPSFYEIHQQLRYLDLGQVDIPNIDQLDVAAFERAVYDASLILGRLQNARDSCEMCNVFLAALTRLANRSLGTVSADTLLGLLMLTVLRVSEDTAEQLELNLYFVSNFSFQASDTVKMKASAGRVSYTLMMFQSVLMQLRKEQSRLSLLAEANKNMWHAIRGDERNKIEEIYSQSPSSLLSRRSGKSALVMAAEDQNSSLLNWLLDYFSGAFSLKFLMKDRDLQNRTLLMITVSNAQTSEVILEALKTVDPEELKRFYNSRDLHDRNLAHYLKISELSAKLAPHLNWSLKDKDGLSPLFHQARISMENFSFFIDYCDDFYDHIDPRGNSLLHVAASNNYLNLAEKILQFPSCDVNWRNVEMKTPIMVSSSVELVSLLLQYGADPWAGKMSANLFPSLRASRLANQGSLPYVAFDREDKLLVFKDATDTKKVKRSLSEFVALGSALQLLSPLSWVPTITFSYSNFVERGTFAYLFQSELVEIEMQRLSYWLRLLKSHPVFSDVKEVSDFLGESPEESKQNEATINADIHVSEDFGKKPNQVNVTSGSLFGQEDEGSILAFLNLGSERLTDIIDGIQEMSRKFSAMCRLQREDHIGSIKIGLLVNRFAKTVKVGSSLADFSTQLDVSLGSSILASRLDQIAFFANDLRTKLDLALQLANKLESWRSHLKQDREKMRALADGTLKVSWVGNAEEKRIHEISNLEKAISRSRREIESLELDLKASHFHLANELSFFNQTQEEELLTQLRGYSKLQLSKSKDVLKRLQYNHTK